MYDSPTVKNVCSSPLLLAPDRRIVNCCVLCYIKGGTQDGKVQYYQLPLWHNKIYDMGFVITHQTNAGLRIYKCRTLTSLLWSHPMRQAQRLELRVNLYSHWNSISLNWTELCYCVIWLRREIWRNVKVTVDKSTSLHQVAICLTKLRGVTGWKTVNSTFNVLQFTTLRTR